MLRTCCICDRRIWFLPAKHLHRFARTGRGFGWCHRTCLLAALVDQT